MSKYYKAWKILTGGSKKSPTITSVGPGKNLTTKRAIQDKAVKTVDEGVKEGLGGLPPSQRLKQSTSKLKKSSSKSFNRKVIGGAGATIAGTVGAHVAAKKKFPKYKKFAESDIKTVDGKLKIVPKKKK